MASRSGVRLIAALAVAAFASSATARERCSNLAKPYDKLEARFRHLDPNERDFKGERTALMCVVANKNLTDEQMLALARLLVPRRPDFNIIDFNGDTVLHLAVLARAPQLAEFLISQGADADFANMSGASPFQMALRSNLDPLVKVFMAHGKFVDNRDESGRTSLYEAARRGDLAVVRQLVARGADAGASKQNALIGAAIGGQVEVIRFLTGEARLSADLRSKDGETPVMGAAAANQLSVLRVLIEELHANPELTSPTGATALSLAATAGHVNVIRYLLDHGASIDASRPSALAAAAMARQPEATKLLMDAGGDLGAGTPDKPGVLYWAAYGGNEIVLAALVSRGAAYPQLPSDVGPLIPAVLNRHFGNYHLQQGKVHEALPFLRDAVAGYDKLSDSLSERVKSLRAAADRQQAKDIALMSLLFIVSAAANAYQAQMQAQSYAQIEALGYANQTGTGVQGYYDMYSQLQSTIAARAALEGAVTAAATTTTSVAGGQGVFAEHARQTKAMRSQADSLEKAVVQYRGESHQLAAALACAQRAELTTASGTPICQQ